MPARWRAWGSSPLTRGKPRAPLRRWPAWRLIPAHAGKTPRRSSARMTRRAHPRSRGENALHPDEVMNALGSSPLTRGKLLGADRALGGRGLIPAHAGKTSPGRRSHPYCRAHPRSRGENFAALMRITALPGSSPLTRGKRVQLGKLRRRIGLIPAHAGKTTCKGPGSRGGAAHPRSRGENEGRAGVCGAAGGSSPLTRGKPILTPHTAAHTGLIPAHAGKTHARHLAGYAPRAHPRSRGENRDHRLAGFEDAGSSPLTRGKH